MLVYKESGITMNQFINKIKELYPTHKIAYAGRLDPMARGIVPILIDDECKNMDMYTSKDKIYHVKIIIGIQTDSDDALGIIQNTNYDFDIHQVVETCNDILASSNNKTINQRFHYFSTKEINKRRKNKENVQSYHIVKLYNSSILSVGILNKDEWVEEINRLISSIDNTKEFRQKEIINQWKSMKNIDKIQYIELELNVSSGFFVRQYIRDLSHHINIPLMCFDIHRVSCS